jgi:hypothetical protein
VDYYDRRHEYDLDGKCLLGDEMCPAEMHTGAMY